jgi:hypothetical protein
VTAASIARIEKAAADLADRLRDVGAVGYDECHMTTYDYDCTSCGLDGSELHESEPREGYYVGAIAREILSVEN